MALRVILKRPFNQISKFYTQPTLLSYYSSKSDKTDAENKAPELEKTSKKDKASQKLNFLLQSIIKDDNPKIEKAKFAQPKPKTKSKKDIQEPSSKKDETQIIKAAENVAASLGGNVQKTKSELISKLLSYSDENKDIMDVNQLITNMRIEAQETPSRSAQTRKILQSKPNLKERTTKTKPVPQAERLDLFGGQPLGIFTQGKDSKSDVTLKTWEHLQNRELRLAVTHPPTNYYQQMILWTEQGKLWKFPIDNEQGMEVEQSVDFADHVFLESHLDDWCPRQGPIRHFMELVCAGLSKNHYLTVAEKRSHIEWFRNYFNDKMDLLKEVGAVALDHEITPSKSI